MTKTLDTQHKSVLDLQYKKVDMTESVTADHSQNSNIERDMVGHFCLAPMCLGWYAEDSDPEVALCDTCKIGLPRFMTKRRAIEWEILLRDEVE